MTTKTTTKKAPKVDPNQSTDTLPRVTVAAAALATALKAALPFAGRDDTLPMLSVVRLSREGDRLRLTATDRFSLCVTFLDGVTWHDAADDWELMMPVGDCKRVVAEWSRDRGTLTISTGDRNKDTTAIDVRDARGIAVVGTTGTGLKHPNVDHLLTGQDGVEYADHGQGVTALNPDQVAKIGGLRRTKGEYVAFQWPDQQKKPILFTVGDHSLGLIMPVRPDVAVAPERILAGAR